MKSSGFYVRTFQFHTHDKFIKSLWIEQFSRYFLYTLLVVVIFQLNVALNCNGVCCVFFLNIVLND